MMKLHIKGNHWRNPLTDPTAEEAATILQQNGLRLEGISKMQTEWLERRQNYPELILRDPLPKEAWVQIAERLRKERGSMPTDSAAYEDAGIALWTAKNMEHGTSLWDALVLQCECCEEQYGTSRHEAQGMLRHAGYIVCESYAGRDVG